MHCNLSSANLPVFLNLKSTFSSYKKKGVSSLLSFKESITNRFMSITQYKYNNDISVDLDEFLNYLITYFSFDPGDPHCGQGIRNQKVTIKCEICGKEKSIRFRNYLAKGQHKLCSGCLIKKSYAENFGSLEKAYSHAVKIREKTTEEKYGTGITNVFQSEIIKNKIRNTCIERYGVANPAKSEFVQKKAKATFLERYGVDNPMHSAEIKEKHMKKISQRTPEDKKATALKTIKTCQEKYGVNSPSQAPEFINKAKNTCVEKYGVESYTQTKEYKEKVKATNLKRYGTEWYLSSKDSMEKRMSTCVAKYGVPYSTQDEGVKDKIRKTCNIRYGSDSFLSSQIGRETIKKRFLEKFGVDNPSKVPEINKKKKREYYLEENNTNIYFDSSWELAYYLFNKNKGVDIQRGPDPIIFTDSKGNIQWRIPLSEYDKNLFNCKNECIDCKHLPLCMGTCPINRRKALNNKESFSCNFPHNDKYFRAAIIRYAHNITGAPYELYC